MLRRGMTLVEVLVTIGIIAMLIALLLPAVQSARESSRRLQCQTQVRELLVATHSHHDAKNAVPSL
jgi:prepilin-type N-terminal cleavage/methylation domain-containing protein